MAQKVFNQPRRITLNKLFKKEHYTNAFEAKKKWPAQLKPNVLNLLRSMFQERKILLAWINPKHLNKVPID